MRRLLALCGAIALVACQSVDDPDVGFVLPTTESNVVGTFQLQTANGFTPPYVAIVTNTEVWTLAADRIVLKSDLTWADTTSYGITRASDGNIRDTATATSGTYSIADGHINFTMTSGGTSFFQGAVVHDTLSVSFQGKLYRYKR